MRFHPAVCRLSCAVVVALLVGGNVARAAVVFFSDSGNIPPGLTLSSVSESYGTDAVPMYGALAYFTTGMYFNPSSFVSSATGGASDFTDGQLNFTVSDTPGGSQVAINTIQIFEAGDFSLTGIGTAAGT